MSTSADQEPTPPDSNALAAGQTVGGDRYVLKKILGQGGMGVVWLAHDKRLREPVALKFLPPQIAFDPAALEDLRRETWRSRKLSHPNIVRIHDLHEGEGERPFITMEYVDGPNLHYLRATKPGRVLNWKFVAPILRQLCAALEYAHEEKVVHRDLKPANLMLDSNGRLKLADFGLACVVHDSMTRLTGHPAVGTLDYMSPQQADGKKPQISDDLYALGASLYDLLTSKPPFYTGDVPYQLRNTRPDPMAQRLADLELANEIPSEVAALVMACLAKDPEQRPPNTRAIIDWLESAANASPTPPVVPTIAPVPTPVPPPAAPPPILLPPIMPVTPPPLAVPDVRVSVEEEPVVHDAADPEPAPSSWDTTSLLVPTSEPELESEPPPARTRPAVSANEEGRASKTVLIASVVIAVAATIATIALVVKWIRQPDGKQPVTVATNQPPEAARFQATFSPSPTPVSGTYESIFNGRDLTGWSGEPRFWKATNGVILGQLPGYISDARGYTALFYRGEPVDDFELRFSFRLHGGNYEVLYRAKELTNFTPSGYAYTVQAASIGNMHESRPGSMRGFVGGARSQEEALLRTIAARKVFRSNSWNEAVIVAQGRRLRHELNGLVLTEGTDNSAERLSSGLLALAINYSGDFSPKIPRGLEFKDLRLKRLAKVTVPAASVVAGSDTGPGVISEDPPDHERPRSHFGPVRSVAVSPNGYVVASAGDDSIIRLWLPYHRRTPPPLSGHKAGGSSVAFSPLDSRRLASGSKDRTVKLWDASTSTLRWTSAELTWPVTAVLFSADGTIIYCATSRGLIEFLAADTGARLRTISAHAVSVSCLALSTDGKLLASAGGDASIRLWNTQSGDLIKTFDRLTTNMTCLSFSPDERTLAAAGGEDRYHVFDVPLGILKRSTPAFNTPVRALVYQPDGEWLVVNGDGRTSGLQLSAADGGLHGYVFPNGTSNITALAAGPDGLRVYGTAQGRVGHSQGGISGPVSTADPFGNPDPARMVKRTRLVEPAAVVPTPAGWVRLLDGKTLQGWEVIGNSQWTVQADGSVTSRGNPGALLTKAQYGDFELKADVKFAYGGIAALGFRLPPGAAEGAGGLGMQASSDIPPGVAKSQVLGKLGMIHSHVVPHDTWVTLRVVVNGNKFQTYLNDQMTMNMSPGTAPPARGQVALLHYVSGVAVSYRNVMIHPLGAAPANP